MDSLLLDNIKNIMVYFRNNTSDKNLCQISIAIKNSVISGNNEILLNELKKDMPEPFFQFYIKEDLYSFANNNCPVTEQFVCDSLDILIEAGRRGESMLVYDIADMMQGIPDLKYWESQKNMRSYWKIYVKPVKKKWNLSGLYLDNSLSIFRKWK